MASLHFTSDFRCIEEVRTFVKDETAGLGLGEGVLYHLQLAVVEAVTNVMVHAYEGAIGKPIWLDVQAGEGMLEVVLRDQGGNFDIHAHPDPDLKRHIAERKVGGLGVYLMRNLMDELDLCREDGYNVLRMRKRLA